MNFLEQRILKDGIVKPGKVLTVDSFLNHQMDIALMEEIGKGFRDGGRLIREMGYDPQSLIIVECMDPETGTIQFHPQ